MGHVVQAGTQLLGPQEVAPRLSIAAGDRKGLERHTRTGQFMREGTWGRMGTPHHRSHRPYGRHPAMLRHILGEQRERRNRVRWLQLAVAREGEVAGRNRGPDDFTLGQVINGEVEWDFLADMATRQAILNQTKSDCGANLGGRADWIVDVKAWLGGGSSLPPIW